MPNAIAAIVPAAGRGTRLLSDRRSGSCTSDPPKALRSLAGRTMLQRSVDALSAEVDQIVVAVPSEYVDRVTLCESGAQVSIVAGGETRQQSVRRALAALSDSVTHVLVHDAARALVPPAVVRRVVAALESGATCVVPVVPVADSLRGVAPGGSNAALDRAAVRLVQTPQGFTVDALRRAHAAARTDLATDDATLVEALGEPVMLVGGDPLGFKITAPLDLLLAEALLAEALLADPLRADPAASA